MNDKDSVNVLEFFCEPLNFGGQEAFIINVYKKVSNKKVKYTFFTPFECQNEKLKSMVEKRNDEIIYLNYNFETKLRKLNIIRAAKKIFKNSRYDVVHIHSGSIFSLYFVAKTAKKSGVKKVIIHSHSTGDNTFKYRIIKYITNRKMQKYVDVFFACSEKAAEWKFPKEVVRQKKFTIIKNGVDIEKFKFNNEVRQAIRNQYNLNNKNVVINIGRFSKEKNHIFLLEIFKEIKKINKNAYLILIGGSGPLKEEIQQLISKYDLKEDVLILENISNVSDYLNASDVFVLPSFYEGFPVVSIEAQTAGIPVICSDTITKEILITPNCHFLSLKDGANIWAEKIIEEFACERIDYEKLIKNNGFDIADTTKTLENIYLMGEVNNEKA